MLHVSLPVIETNQEPESKAFVMSVKNSKLNDSAAHNVESEAKFLQYL